MAHLNPFVTCLHTDADTAEKSVEVDVEKIVLIENLSADDSITFSFDASSGDSEDVITLDKSTKIENLDFPVKKLYYKSLTADNKNFRFIGLKKRY